MTTLDTIAAVASPPGRGGISVVRVSGPAVPVMLRALSATPLQPRRASLRPLVDADGRTIDSGLLLWFPAPASFTGEHVIEFHGHGGTVVTDMVLNRFLQLGARLARPGEFTERAYLNGRIDLAQAEAIADLIDSHSEQAVRSAQRSLSGEFSRELHGLMDTITRLRVLVEAAMDFPDEELDLLGEVEFQQRLDALRRAFQSLRDRSAQGFRLREGVQLVIVGQPNVGKSSLLNLLARRNTAIVTDIPGTTRDLLREDILVDGLPVHLVDTAGLRDTTDRVEQAGIDRAWQAVENADGILFMVDDRFGFTDADRALFDRLPTHLPRLVVHNKIDRSGSAAGFGHAGASRRLYMSVEQARGLDDLYRWIRDLAGYQGHEGVFMARRRHLDGLGQAAGYVEQAHAQLRAGTSPELAADDLRLAHRTLGGIVGEVSSDELLGEIFSSFCIGK